MPFRHAATATKDREATHRSDTEVMGFRLLHAEVAATPEQTGWAGHRFYGDGARLAVTT
jgi:hypothetical protein